MVRSNSVGTPVPMRPGEWLLGNLRAFRSDRLAFYELIQRELGPFAGYRLGSKKLVLVTDSTALRQIFVMRHREFGRSFSTRLLGVFFGDGLLISEGGRWLQDRRLMQSAFSKEQVNSYAESMVEHTEQTLANWQAYDSFDVLVEMQSLTMKIAADTLLGVEMEEEVDAIHRPHEVIRSDFDYRMEHIALTPIWIPNKRNRIATAARESIRRIVNDLIAQRKRESRTGNDILSRLIGARDEDGTKLTDVQLCDQALTMLFAGHETTASVLGWVWYLLSQHSDAEAKLHHELDVVLGERRPEIADVERLPYCGAVVRETLRLFPSAYVISRNVNESCELSGYALERDMTLVASPWVMQRDERFFERPHEFEPERWLDDLEERLDPFSFFPFGAGPRVCIGKAFAMLELVLIVATIARRMRLVLEPNQIIKPHASITIRPSPSVLVSASPRTS